MELKKNILWNSVGSLYYLGMQWLTTVLVVRLSGNYEDAGLYSLAISITNIFYIVAMYNVRNFQVSDINGQYQNEDYIAHRITTIILALIACMIFVAAVYREVYTICVIVCYMVFKSGESLVDVLHGIDQKEERMDIIGKSYLIRGTVMIVVFILTELLTKNLFLVVAAMAAATIVLCFQYDVRTTYRHFPFRIRFRKEKIRSLYTDCFPFLIYGIALNLISSIPRIMVEKMYGKELLGYYASVATPAVIVQSMANVIFMPFVTVFTKYYTTMQKSRFEKLAVKMTGFCVGLGVIFYFGSAFAGRFILEKILYRDSSIGPYCYLLNSTMICTTLVAVIWLLVIFMTIGRANRALEVVSAAGVISEIGFSLVLIDKNGIDGINQSLICTYVIIIAGMGIVIYRMLKKHFG